ncbi:PAS domain S-box protein (plasmid) [Halorussus limi]|uniref:histidine kinase n=1 Tax=Halorussus limi TaxID=2938695 RepID=A0A8U0I123_9EURY|nr:PAS domain S-box protein [Halorussus limi]UPV76888.1 PAS domain S-box protein [Halorussus limi]
MGYGSQAIGRVGGRRALLALGGLYIAIAAGSPVLQVLEGRASDDILVIAILVGSAGVGLLYAGYRLPRTDIRPDLYGVIATWCVRTIGVLLGILLLVEVIAGIDDPVGTVLILTPLASVAGLGMGVHDATAKTRALNAEEQRREAEERRQEAERYSRELERANRKLERYETIVETVEDGIYVVDKNGYFTLVNGAYAEMLGYDREELLGSHTSLVAENAETLADKIRDDLEADGSETGTYEATLETASGEEIEAEATMAFLPGRDSVSHDRVAVVRDVTERNEREQELERQNQRLESFASMLAHELRNPVNIGQIYSQQLPADTESEAVEYVTEAFDRIEDMIDVMLVLARGRDAVGSGSPVRLADVAREAWEDVNAPEATLEIDVDVTTRADDTYLRHLFGNLFKNAVEHGGADVTVTVGALPTGFYVADDGPGIPVDERDTVFEPGYTTAGEQGGTGLGLAFVRELAEVYEWTYTVTQSDAGGAQFEFTDLTTVQRATE